MNMNTSIFFLEKVERDRRRDLSSGQECQMTKKFDRMVVEYSQLNYEITQLSTAQGVVSSSLFRKNGQSFILRVVRR